jgi:hypothetical protein
MLFALPAIFIPFLKTKRRPLRTAGESEDRVCGAADAVVLFADPSLGRRCITRGSPLIPLPPYLQDPCQMVFPAQNVASAPIRFIAVHHARK